MINKVLALLVIAAVAGVALGGLWLLPPGDVYASNHSATRSFSATSVGPGDTVTVTILVSNYGGIGQVVDTVPAGFSPGGNQVFNLVGDTSWSYTVTAPDTSGTYTFSGTLRDVNGDPRTISGPNRITVTAPTTPTPSAVRSMPASVTPGDTVTVTIRVSNYGGIGQIVDTVPAGFSPSGDQVFNLVGDTSWSYTVTAPDTTGTYAFSGTLKDSGGASHSITGRDSIRVGDAAPPPPPPPPSPTDRQGMVTLSDNMPMVGDMLTATLTDADGGISGTAWQWSRCEDSAGDDCAGIHNANSDSDTTTMTSYTPVEADDGKYLKAMAMYRDENRSGRTAEAITTNMVQMANILSDYDADDSGMIEKSEAVMAVLDYLLRNSITKEEAIEVVTAFILRTEV